MTDDLEPGAARVVHEEKRNPVVAAKVTTAPGTQLPASSRTTTVGATGTNRPTGACWLSPAVATISAPVGAVAVAVNTTGLLATPPSSTRAASDWVPTVGPRIQVPTAAKP